jgi:hypothetical protein
MLTVIFAVYVADLLGALLTVGSLSDHLSSAQIHSFPADRGDTVSKALNCLQLSDPVFSL